MAKVYFGKANVSLNFEAAAKSAAEVEAALSAAALQRLQETVTKLIQGDFFGLDKALAVAAAQAAIADKVTAQDIEGMEAEALEAKALEWLRRQGVEIGGTEKKKAAPAVKEKRGKVANSAKDWSKGHIVSARLCGGLANSDKLDAKGKWLSYEIASMLPVPSDSVKNIRHDITPMKGKGLDLHISEAQFGALATRLYGRNTPETRKRLTDKLREVANTSIESWIESGEGKQKTNYYITGLLMTLGGEGDKATRTLKNADLYLSPLFYYFIREYYGKANTRLLAAGGNKKGSAEYVALCMWYSSTEPQRAAALKFGGKYVAVYPYVNIAGYDTEIKQRKYGIRQSVKAAAERLAETLMNEAAEDGMRLEVKAEAAEDGITFTFVQPKGKK